jgi:hypothetical protein
LRSNYERQKTWLPSTNGITTRGAYLSQETHLFASVFLLNRISIPKTISDAIDAEASRRFSIYIKDAQINGYGFQAYLVEKKAVPQVEQALAELALEKDSFDATVPQAVKDLVPRQWNWRRMAEIVGLVDEYDYIYSFASKLLHATPASITTDHKNLELEEMEVFLKYIDVKLADLEALAQEYCK